VAEEKTGWRVGSGEGWVCREERGERVGRQGASWKPVEAVQAVKPVEVGEAVQVVQVVEAVQVVEVVKPVGVVEPVEPVEIVKTEASREKQEEDEDEGEDPRRERSLTTVWSPPGGDSRLSEVQTRKPPPPPPKPRGEE